MHRDLKPENILFTSDNTVLVLKIIDFGRYKILKPKELVNELAGTVRVVFNVIALLDYLAPEIIKNVAYDEACDMWSCGVIMYLLLTGALPFKGITKEKTLEAIRTVELDYSDKVWS
jgi:serine/threonine protein kinase